MIARIHDGTISPLTNSLLGNTPVGTIIGWRGTEAPNGYLPCMGQQYDTSLYSDLYKVLKSNTLPASYDTSVVNYDAAEGMTLSSTATVIATSGILYTNYFNAAMTLTVNGKAVHMQSNNAQSKSWFYPVSAGDSVVTNNSITVMFAPYKYVNYIKTTMLAATGGSSATVIAVPKAEIGTVISYGGNSTPQHYLECNGSTFDSSVYPELYRVLGSSKLPNLYDPTSLQDYEDAYFFSGAPHNISSVILNRSLYGSENSWTAPADGIITFEGIASYQWTGYQMNIYVNGEFVAQTGVPGGTSVQFYCEKIHVKEGDTVYHTGLPDSTYTGYNVRQWYFQRYTKHQYIRCDNDDMMCLDGTIRWSSEDTQIGTWTDGTAVYRKVLTFSSVMIPAATWTSIGSSNGRILSCSVINSNGSYPVACRMNNSAIEVWSPLEIAATGAVIERIEEQ